MEDYSPAPEPGDDLYPQSNEEHQKLLGWCQDAFKAAESARKEHEDRWTRYYKLYRSYIKRKKDDWRSHVFIPLAFTLIETSTPRLVAQLPKMTAKPRGPDDIPRATSMEDALDWAANKSDLYLALVASFRSALKYGTGILKTYPDQKFATRRVTVQEMKPITETMPQPVVDPETGQPMFDPDGNEVSEDVEIVVGQEPVVTSKREKFVSYDGPCAEAVDPFNFFPAPEADDIDSARYVCQRGYKDWSDVEKLFEQGIYQYPFGDISKEVFGDDDNPALERQSEIGLGGNKKSDPTRRPLEVLEFWTKDDKQIIVLNQRCIVRVVENPFDHLQKPYIRIVDYWQEHEFWGVGEIEAIEGLQDAENVLVNSRIDNVRLVLNGIFGVNVNKLEDVRDLQLAPGRAIRTKGDERPSEIVERIDLGDVTASSFTEAAELERLSEKTSGVSGLQMGMDTMSQQETATGVSQLLEQGASRFALKTRLAELMGLKRLALHFGTILTQFTSDDILIPVLGEMGAYEFKTITPEALQGSFDFDIEAQSIVQTETIRREQSLNLFQVLFGVLPPGGQIALIEDLLRTHGKKDVERYLAMPTMAPEAPVDPTQQGAPEAGGLGPLLAPPPTDQGGS